MNHIEVDGKLLDLEVAGDQRAASIYPRVLEHVLDSGRIVTSLRLGAEEVVWEDGSPRWGQTVTSVNCLSVTTELAVRITAPLLQRMEELLPTVAQEHRQQATRLRETMIWSDRSASIMEPWSELQLALGQVAALHGIDWTDDAWAAFAAPLQDLSTRLRDSLRDLKDTLERGDLILAADLLDFELATLAEDWRQPLADFRSELQRRFRE